MTIDAMDGRQRGNLLRGKDGKFVTRTDWKNGVQREINEFFNKNQVYRKYLDQNPDLKTLIRENDSKINDRKKEMRLVDNSKRGINDRVKIYREAMEKQGLKGQQLEEQVARYREGLLTKRRKHFNKLKGEKFAENIGKQKPVKPEPGKKGFKIPKGLKKVGKVGGIALAAGLAIAGLAALFKGCESEKEQPVEEVTTPPAEETQEETPVQEELETPAYDPIVKLNDDGTYTTKKNDNFYKLAENLLKDYCITNGLDKTITNKSPEVQLLAEKIMKANQYWYNPNCTEATKRHSAPMLYPDENLIIPDFSNIVDTGHAAA